MVSTCPNSVPDCAPSADDALTRRLVAALAHTVNNSLTGVVGYLDLALHQAPDAGDLRRQLQAGLACAYEAAAAVRQVVAFAAATSTSSTTEPVSLTEVAAEIQQRLRRAGEPCEVVADAASDDWIEGNRALLLTAVDQLVRNAREAMPADRPVVLRVDGSDDRCRLAVCDSGPGIPDEMLSHIFEPFMTTKSSGHLGLGLALARSIVEAHGAELRIASIRGRGVTATLDFPALEPHGHRAAGDESIARLDQPRRHETHPHYRGASWPVGQHVV